MLKRNTGVMKMLMTRSALVDVLLRARQEQQLNGDEDGIALFMHNVHDAKTPGHDEHRPLVAIAFPVS